jgi:hypothetical protein
MKRGKKTSGSNGVNKFAPYIFYFLYKNIFQYFKTYYFILYSIINVVEKIKLKGGD